MRVSLNFIIILLLILGGCVLGGTHGSIKNYDFPISKYVLEKAVLKVISSSPNIQRDTAKNYYNDGENYITLEITKGDILNRYTFRFYGGKEDWDTAKTSEIFIAYAKDKEGNGGSEGNGAIKWYKPGLKKELVSLFESEFISKLDKELGVNHTEPD
jgi:hypothetical protein